MLKLHRKAGQVIEIIHRGEKLVIKVEKIRRSKTDLLITGSKSFAIVRGEAKSKIGKEEVNCFVQVSDDPEVDRLQLAVVLDRIMVDGCEFVEVEYQDGKRERISSEKVRILRKDGA